MLSAPSLRSDSDRSGEPGRLVVVGSAADCAVIASCLPTIDVAACDGIAALQAAPDDVIVLVDQAEQLAANRLPRLRAHAPENSILVLAEAPCGHDVEAWMDLGADDVIGRSELDRLGSVLRRERVHRSARRALVRLQEDFMAFSTAISHDFRAPARIIHGFAQVLRDETSDWDDRRRGDLAIIGARARQMGEMIDALTTWARIGAGPLSPAEVDMETLAWRAASAVFGHQGKHDVEVHIDPLPPLRGDSDALFHVWSVLFSNAAKFSRGRCPARISVQSESSPTGIAFRMQDNGVGFEPSCAGRLFGVFQRLHSGTEFPGLGMGLARVRRIIEWHGGTVAAEGLPDRGATFTFTLPRP